MKKFEEKTIWQGERHFLDDGKFHMNVTDVTDKGIEHPAYFPGYIEDKNHPLLFCNSLTHRDKQGNVMSTWSGSDSPDNFEKNKSRAPKGWKYFNKEIVYKVNNSGYRTYNWDEVNWEDSILLLGCSCTYGVGVAEDETLAYLLEKISGKKVINLGSPAGSNSLIVTLLSLALEKFPKPKAVVINWTAGDRYRHYFRNRFFDVGPWNSKNLFGKSEIVDGISIGDAWESRYLNRYNELAENFYLAKMAKAMCSSTKYVSLSYFDYIAHYTRSDFFVPADISARDMLHPGANIHLQAAKQIHKLL